MVPIKSFLRSNHDSPRTLVTSASLLTGQAALGITNHKIDNSPLSRGRGRALLNEKTEKA